MRELSETMPAFFAFFGLAFLLVFIPLTLGGIAMNSLTLFFLSILGDVLFAYMLVKHIIIIGKQFKEVRRIDNEKISEHSENMEDRAH